jgi:diguanylate cyclase (GGDEF)-like protein/PAS domain S-box-containing protein
MSHADGVSREEFSEFVANLRVAENYPGMQALSYVQIVPAAQKQQHIAAMRSAGFAHYAIVPDSARAMYVPVIYIEPISVMNLRAIGHDPFAEPGRRALMEQSRDLEVPVITGNVKLVLENDKNRQASFLMYLPVFKFGAPHNTVAERRASIMGWVSAPFRMNDLMEGLLGVQADKFDIEIYDGEQPLAGKLMYDADGNAFDDDARASLFSTIKRIRIANHTWTLKMRSLPAFDARLDRDSSRVIAYCGVGISALLALLALMLASGREIARQAAGEMYRELIERETRYRQMFQSTTCIAYLFDPDSGRIVDANTAAATFWGYSMGQLRTMKITEINTEAQAQLAPVWCQVVHGENAKTQWRHRLQDGQIRDVEVFLSPLTYHGEQLLYAIVHDVSERKQAEQALADESARHAMLLRTASDGIHVLDMQGNLAQANDAFCRLLGYAQEELQGMHVTEWDVRWSACEIEERFDRLLQKDELFEARHQRRDGSIVDVEIHACSVVIGGKQLMYASARDITERKKAAERLDHLAHFDILTDLPNRALLHDRLQQALARAKRDSVQVALMFLDLDKFKSVNDRFGHHVGDLLLQEAASRLRNCLRASDTVARVGGDEFVVLLPHIAEQADARRVAQKVLALLEQPFNLAGQPVRISATIGIAIYPQDASDEQLLIKSADQAMYHAKHAGGSVIMSYGDLKQPTPEMAC